MLTTLWDRSVRKCRSVLVHPDMRGLDIDAPQTTELRRSIVQKNGFLRSIYDEWYGLIQSRIPRGDGGILELGSGAGFLPDYVPDAITSEVLMCRGVDAILDARQLPFRPSSLKAIVMIDVFHHIPESRSFLHQAARCVRNGGVILMVEPWVSVWSQLIYTHLHHEPFDPKAADWSFPSTGPLSGANGALPWIVFKRDRKIFEREFPELSVREVRPIMPFRYLVSGGVSMRQLMPASSYPVWRFIDNCLSGWDASWPMFALIEIGRQ